MNIKQLTLFLIPISFVSIAIFYAGYLAGANDFPAERQELLLLKVSNKFTETALACNNVNALADYNSLSATLSMYEGVKSGELDGAYQELEKMLKGFLKNELQKTATYFPLITDPELKERALKTKTRAEEIVSNNS